MTYKLSPSILAADITCLGQEVKTAQSAGADYIHIDVMDGVFVPNLSFGTTIVRGLRECTDLFFDVHLMLFALFPMQKCGFFRTIRAVCISFCM